MKTYAELIAAADLQRYAGRVAITVAQFAATPAFVDHEVAGYLFNEEAESYGMDPWRVVEGIDPHIEGGKFDLWLACGRCIADVDGASVIYVAKKHADAFLSVAA